VDEVIAMANNTMYGLAAGVFTRDINIYLTIVNSLEAGTVW
jgi:acyl-CoA reductase-like NAD-dependent aldehyde dehydrogenase